MYDPLLTERLQLEKQVKPDRIRLGPQSSSTMTSHKRPTWLRIPPYQGPSSLLNLTTEISEAFPARRMMEPKLVAWGARSGPISHARIPS